MIVKRLDPLVLTVHDIEASVDFYQRVLGMTKEVFSEGRIALSFGEQKINLHESGSEFEPKAGLVQAGSADLCFIIETPLSEAVMQLRGCKVELLEGPVKRTGALGPIMSLYFRDPDMNLIEVSNYL
jgi:catechol 2,3-dioxygenase-like lactoylglutathione lyase family enzyme